MLRRFNFIANIVGRMDIQSVRLLILTLATTLMLLIVSWFPLSIMGFLGLMPSLIIIILEARSSMILFRTVLPLNVLGVAWVYIDIVQKYANGPMSATLVVKNPIYWITILSMVGAGLFLYIVMPRIVMGWSVFKISSEIKLVRRRREQLRKKWGRELVFTFVEEEGVGSEVIDFLLRNGMIDDLEGNLSFVTNSAASTNDTLGNGRGSGTEPLQGELTVGAEPLESLEIVDPDDSIAPNLPMPDLGSHSGALGKITVMQDEVPASREGSEENSGGGDSKTSVVAGNN